MPLHDWSKPTRWAGVHHTWISELNRAVKETLPPGYRSFIDSNPILGIGIDGNPDIGVETWPDGDGQPAPTAGSVGEPDFEVAVLTLDLDKSLFVTDADGRMVAAVELISPRNKDRPSSRARYLNRYLGYMHGGANVVMIDVHPRPFGFSFGDAMARELKLPQKPLPSPMGVAYRVGGDTPDGGQFLAAWARPFVVGEPLPVLPLPLTTTEDIPLPLEETYMRAARDAYLS